MTPIESGQEEKVKLEWLRAAAREGFDAMERGDYTSLATDDAISAFIRKIHDEG